MSTDETGDYPIIIEGLCNGFGDQLIHENLSLKVRRGEILYVLENLQENYVQPG